QDIRLEYLRLYAEPAQDSDVLATPATDDEVLVHLVCASALQWVGSDEAKRLRYQDARGLSPAAQAEAYRRAGSEALRFRTARLQSRTLEIS
ncbi:MAG: hypothetical protein HY000_07740, partial [Planctomycetes bacterium]|nr:hypothetical protein [Planctomycetota bacterium]